MYMLQLIRIIRKYVYFLKISDNVHTDWFTQEIKLYNYIAWNFKGCIFKLCVLVHMHFRVYVYHNCSRTVHYFVIINHALYTKICLISPKCYGHEIKETRRLNHSFRTALHLSLHSITGLFHVCFEIQIKLRIIGWNRNRLSGNEAVRFEVHKELWIIGWNRTRRSENVTVQRK